MTAQHCLEQPPSRLPPCSPCTAPAAAAAPSLCELSLAQGVLQQGAGKLTDIKPSTDTTALKSKARCPPLASELGSAQGTVL